MKRRDFLKTAAVGAALPMLGGAAARAAAGAKKPNILLLMVDQWRGDCLGADGNTIVKTPNIDALAREGVLFKAAYTSVAACTPARAALITGLSPWHHGQLGMGAMREQYKFELPQALRDAGYYTFGIGKMHFSPQRALHGFHGILLDESGRMPTADYRVWFAKVSGGKDPDALGIGWNDYDSGIYPYPEEWHPTHWTAQTAIDMIKDYKDERPFFFKVSWERPHSPYDPPQRFMDMYTEEEMPAPHVADWAARYADAGNPVPAATWKGNLGVKQAKKSRRGYYGNITFIDEQVGRIVKTLKEKGVYENTLILFVADHGDMTGDHNLWRKTYAYEPSSRIPLIVRWPEAMGHAGEHGTTRPNPVEIRDVLPTFLDAAGAPVPKFVDGASLLQLVRDPKAPWRGFIDLEYCEGYAGAPYWSALTDGKWKYIYFSGEDTQQLFNLADDPHEMKDLSKDPAHAAELSKWRQRLADHLAERGEPYVTDGKIQPHPSIKYSPYQATGYPATEAEIEAAKRKAAPAAKKTKKTAPQKATTKKKAKNA